MRGVDAWIDINPPTAAEPDRQPHVMTITVHSVGGSLAAGTATATVHLRSLARHPSTNCNYAAGAASSSCQVVITSCTGL